MFQITFMFGIPSSHPPFSIKWSIYHRLPWSTRSSANGIIILNQGILTFLRCLACSFRRNRRRRARDWFHQSHWQNSIRVKDNSIFILLQIKYLYNQRIGRWNVILQLLSLFHPKEWLRNNWATDVHMGWSTLYFLY